MDMSNRVKTNFNRPAVAAMLMSRNALSELDAPDSIEIVNYMNAKRVNAKDTVLQEGFDNTGFLALILQGQAVVENEFAKKGDSLVITMVGEGALIGELGLIDGQPRSATVRAITDLDLAVLERPALTKMMKEKPDIACKLLASLLANVSYKLRATNKKMRTMHAINRSMQDELVGYTSGHAPLASA